MVAKKLVQRTVWEANCKCGETYLKEDGAPRSKRCKCGTWVDFEEKSTIAPDLGLPGYK